MQVFQITKQVVPQSKQKLIVDSSTTPQTVYLYELAVWFEQRWFWKKGCKRPHSDGWVRFATRVIGIWWSLYRQTIRQLRGNK